MLDRINSGTKVIEKALDTSWLRNEVISQNIANVDTPGYKKKSVTFEQQLNDAFEKNSKNNIDEIEPKVIQENTNLNYRLDGNNVDVDIEMSQMAKNTIKYNVLTQSLNSTFRRMKSVINEGRR